MESNKPLTISELNRQVRFWLESEHASVRVQGELSNLSKPSSGHYYFTLKDSQAQLRCVYFRNHRLPQGNAFYKEGQSLIAKGKLSLYEARGDYQLIVHELEPAGFGELYQQFEMLKAKLKALGLFETTRKKIIPRYPSKIGIITSINAAALQDILSTLKRRYPLSHIKIYNSEVQGKQAPFQLIQALESANAEKQCDVLILARGGGNIEDLWAFNDEKLAYAIYQSTIPIVSGIGHEIDFTIADFVADLRAPTPTAAAEAVAPHSQELLSYLKGLERSMILAMNRFIEYKHLQLEHAMAKVLSPQGIIGRQWQRLDYLSIQLSSCCKNYLRHLANHLHVKLLRLNSKNPKALAILQSQQLQQYLEQLKAVMLKKHQYLSQRLTTCLARLEALSPLATLKRGYAIVTSQKGLVLNSHAITTKEWLHIQLAKGKVNCEVIEIIE